MLTLRHRSPSPAGTTAELLRRIDELESLVRRQSENPPPLNLATQMPLHSLDETTRLTLLSSITSPLEVFPPTQSIPSMPVQGPDRNVEWVSQSPDLDDEEPLTIHIGHLTPTGSMFSLKPIQKLIGEYPEDFFFQIESARQFVPEILKGSTQEALLALNLDKSHTDSLLAAFFSEIHPNFPIINIDSFVIFFNNVMENPEDEQDITLCLTVLALGKLASNRQACSPGQCTGDDGFDYFSLAYRILALRWITSFDVDLSLASGLVFSAIYLCYLERPLHTWKMVHMASTKLQIMMPQ